MSKGRGAPRALEADGLILGSTATAEPVSAIIDATSVRRIQPWRVDALRPNVHNARLFPDSLSDEQITLLAQDLAKRGQQVPLNITPGGTLVDGERRWRAAKSLGWEHVDAIVGEELTDGQILGLVIDACASMRQMTPREQANIYVAVLASLAREVGNAPGRPSGKRSSNGDLFVPAPELKRIAAAKARFSSVSIAERAEAVFTRATEDIQARVCNYELSISGAYELVPKRARTPTAREGSGAPLEKGGIAKDQTKGRPSSSKPVTGLSTSVEMKTTGASSRASQRQAPVPSAANPSTDGAFERNVLDNPFDVPSRAAAVSLAVRSSDVRRGPVQSRERAASSDVDEPSVAPNRHQSIEPALKVIEAYAETLLGSDSEESDGAFNGLVARLKAMIGGWESIRDTPGEGNTREDDDLETEVDSGD